MTSQSNEIETMKKELTKSFEAALKKCTNIVQEWDYGLSDAEEKLEIQELMCDETDRLVAEFEGVDDDDAMWQVIDHLNQVHFGIIESTGNG